MKKLPDNQLTDLIKENNHLAFTAVVNRYWEGLYRHIHARIRQEEDVKDMLQEIFIALWKNRETLYLDAKGTLASYLFKAARYSIINYYSRPQQAICNEALLENLLLDQSSVTVQELLETKELEEKMIDELDRMPERLQRPFRLSRYSQLSNKEIAAYLSLSEQTVKNNISLTLHHLRAFLQKDLLLIVLFFIIP